MFNLWDEENKCIVRDIDGIYIRHDGAPIRVTIIHGKLVELDLSKRYKVLWRIPCG